MQLRGLRCLDLSTNYITKSGAEAIAAHLGGDRGGGTLRCLSLFHCSMGADGVSTVLGSLSRNTSLLWLDLGANYTEQSYISPSALEVCI